MALTEFAVRNAKPREKAYKLADASGLYLLIQPNGSKLWRHKYLFMGKEKLLAYGSYPLISIAEARAKRDTFKKLLADGSDPSVKKKLDKIAAATVARNTFGLVADEFLAQMEQDGAAETTMTKNR